ncbi:MAG: cytochrome b N-terminal domain-containing protein [Desulfobulbaceae bacterium]|nr:cytochrome b N-terminal domain-containing protein [Desulfobulbaceae bacterium]
MARIKEYIIANRWGGQALISLFISILSGVVIALQYNPAEPFYSTATLEFVIPYGAFWRGLHYYSSQAFFLLLLCHLGVILWQKEYSYTRFSWIRLTASVPVTILLLFTGYVLRGDATGEAAGAIAEHIALSIPLLGKPLNNLLFDVMAGGVQKVYANHLIGLMVLGIICVWPHLRRYTAYFRNHALLSLTLVFLSIVLSTPMEPERIGLTHIAGPWFFLGLQELLRFLPIFWAGVAAPTALIVALFLLPEQGRERKHTLFFILAWLLGYTILSWISYGRI